MNKFSVLLITLLVVEVAIAKENCPKGSHWVNSYNRAGYIRYDGVTVKPAAVRAHCRRNPRGFERWHKALANDRPELWNNNKEKSKKWTVEDVQRFLDAISVLPDNLIEIKNIKV